MVSLSSVVAIILCLGLSTLRAQETLDCIETKNKQINKTKGESGQRKKAAWDRQAFPSVWSCQPLSFGMIPLTTVQPHTLRIATTPSTKL